MLSTFPWEHIELITFCPKSTRLTQPELANQGPKKVHKLKERSHFGSM